MRNLTGFILILAVFSPGIFLSGCATIRPAEPLAGNSNTASVYFIMPNSGVTITGGGIAVGTKFFLWHGDTFISTIGGRDRMIFNFEAGTHYFMASGGNWYTVQAELAAGKTYYFEVITLPGFSYPNVRLRFIEPGDLELNKYLEKSKEITPRGKVSNSRVKTAGQKLNEAKNGSENIDIIPADKGI